MKKAKKVRLQHKNEKASLVKAKNRSGCSRVNMVSRGCNTPRNAVIVKLAATIRKIQSYDFRNQKAVRNWSKNNF